METGKGEGKHSERTKDIINFVELVGNGFCIHGTNRFLFVLSSISILIKLAL